ncbi:hypothetical protein BS50DRAFT_612664 [Corynespora cassiicola Philippines]|uniref:Uncharacterized protein n=1 Tax=Corynespora cassiicola Philippines TaxID=1448308 RepID=A0A2T2NDI4_CORCC|nr:hypothetical protein BS50DRAFT_612664 [Corynespora cassiicola Philippines]
MNQFEFNLKLRKYTNHSTHFFKLSKKKLVNGCISFRDLVAQDKNKKTFPRIEVFMLAFICLVVFFAMAVIAINFPRKSTMIIVVVVSVALAVVLGGCFLVDIYLGLRECPSSRSYSRTLANSTITVILTISLMSTDTVLYPQFPAVAFFQGWGPSQANVSTSELKCSSGPRNDDAAQCSSLSLEEAIGTQSCDCGDSWPGAERLERGDNVVMWLNRSTTYYAMVPSRSTISKGAGHFLSMQLFFSYNRTNSLLRSSVMTAPGIWMVVYDPTYEIGEAIEGGEIFAAVIDANSHVVVNIGLEYYQYINKRSIYRYDVSISIRQNLDLVCDVDQEGWYPCHLTLEMQIPSFLRRTIREEKSIKEVASNAGAYLALVQFLSWIISGAAWG